MFHGDPEKPTITKVLSYMLVRVVPALLRSSVVAASYRPELMIGDTITSLDDRLSKR